MLDPADPVTGGVQAERAALPLRVLSVRAALALLLLFAGACGADDVQRATDAPTVDDRDRITVGGDTEPPPVADSELDNRGSVPAEPLSAGGGTTGSIVVADVDLVEASEHPSVQPGEDDPDSDLDSHPEDSDSDLDSAPEELTVTGRVGGGYPSLVVTDLRSGQEVELAAVLADHDRRLLLWFWEPGPSASVPEAAVVQRLADERRDKVDVVALGVGGDIEMVERFLSERGLTGGSTMWDGTAEVAEHYRVTSLPAAILLDANGGIIARWANVSPEVFEFLGLLSST